MKQEEPELLTTGNSFTVKYKGKFLYSSKNPLGNIKRLISALTIREKTLVFVPGLGLGYGLPELLGILPPDSYILCVESDQKLMNLCLRTGTLSGLQDKRLILLRTDSPQAAVKSLLEIGIQNVRRVQTVVLCAAYHLFPGIYKTIRDALEIKIKYYWQNKITTIFMGRLMVKNYFANLPQLSRIHDISALTTDLPIVVTGAGPSLDHTVETLRRIRKHVLIMATDTALNNLLEHGITPDFIFSLEAQFVNLEDFISNSRFDIPLICDFSVTPQVLRRFTTVYCVSSEFFKLRIFDRLAKAGLLPSAIPPLGSVGNAAVYCALMVTSGPVLLAGLDFAYAGQTTHAKSTYFHKLMLGGCNRLTPIEQFNFTALLKRPLFTVEGKNGTPLLTDLILNSYAENLGNLVSMHHNRIFDINPTGLDCGAEQYTDRKRLQALLAHFQKKAPNLSPAVRPGKAAHRGAETILEFIALEEKLLQEALETIEALLGRPVKEQDTLSEDEYETVKAVDYIYFHLAHKTALPHYTPSLLQHIKAFCYFYRTKMARIKKAIAEVTPQMS